MMEMQFDNLALTLGERLSDQRLMISTAESCTGGWVSKLLTDIPGTSRWFDCGFITYSNHSKQQMLGVRVDTLDQEGAVSEAVVREMVHGVLERSRANVALAISGIAGPAGGTPDKPVGTVWIAWQREGSPSVARCFFFNGDREAIRLEAARHALQGMLELVEG